MGCGAWLELHLPWSDQVPVPDEQRTGVDPELLPASMRLAEPTLGTNANGSAPWRSGWRRDAAQVEGEGVPGSGEGS